MKISLLLLWLVLLTPLVYAQDVNIPDEKFLHELIKKGYDTNNDSIIQVSEAEAVTKLNLYQKDIYDFTGLQSFINLKWLDISHNLHLNVKGVAMDFTMMPNLVYLDASVNNFSDVNVTNLEHLDTLDIEQLNLGTFDFTGLEKLKFLNITFNKFETIDLTMFTELLHLDMAYNDLDTVDASPCVNLRRLNIGSNGLKSLDITGLTKLEELYLSKADISELDLSTQESLKRLTFSYTNLPSHYTFATLPSLEELYFSHNTIQSIDVNHLPKLKTLSCSYNEIKSLDLTGMKSLERVDCHFNEMDTLILTGCDSLTRLRAWENNYTGIDLSDQKQMFALYLSDNDFTALDLSSMDSLYYFDAHGNQLTEVDFSHNKNLETIRLQENDLTSIDVSFLHQLHDFNVQNNPNLNCLSRLPNSIRDLNYRNTGVQCISNIPTTMVDYLNALGPNFFFTLDEYQVCLPDNNPNDCPTFPTVYGNVFYDYDKDGVKDDDENNFEGLEITFNPGEQVFTTDENGYYYAILSDTGSFTATVSTPEHFDAVPQTFEVATSDYSDKIVQDIPLQSNKEVNDLYVRIPYFTRARPGFYMRYVVEVLNHGTEQVENVEVTLTIPAFELADSLSDFSANEETITYTIDKMNVGELHKIDLWGRTSLDAFGEEVEMIAEVEIDGIEDDNAENNTESVEFIVTGSYDPNDKQARDSITTEEVEAGIPLDYLIRFQNTGTDTAFNVYILDTLSDNLDLETFEVLSVSHDFEAVWYDSNVVVFTFENILLPDSIVDEPNSHGYINYQVSPKTTLVEGDSIQNTAYIYFDFNKPIVTNTVTTLVYNPPPLEEEDEEEGEEEDDDEIISSSVEEIDQGIVFYPNPIKGSKMVYFKSEQLVTLEISNSSGKLMLRKEKVSKSFSVKELPSGIYFLRYTSGDGNWGVRKLIIE
ncbi:T9SS type A sorting domain-containing protein [Flammeovirga sp. MY04]|uniref:DUF7619 domain-containing protein n=1 Tax=Flammeovirga sp. MY04 TaxID=1191459 RepID=UPI00080625D0|nr:T9SS type A sorting domain-containing protein [Flammeovirga sp. MY04]ANQ49483.1 T9SS type A sorting domain-containing protein [Flammeovirga sp. MY04]